MNCVDKYGLYNVRPVKEGGEPSGNDGWILTSYAKNLGFVLDYDSLKDTFDKLEKIPGTKIPIERLPGKKTPFLSRDVILGLVRLGFITVDDLIENDWSFSPFPLEGFSPIKTVKQFWDLRPEIKINLPWKDKETEKEAIEIVWQDRNKFWKEPGHEQVYRTAFSVPIQDRAFILRDAGRKVPLHWSLYEKASRKLSSESDSSRLIAWAKGYEKADPEVFRSYFGPGHPFTLKVEANAKQ